MAQYTRNCPTCNRVVVHESPRDFVAKYLCKKAIQNEKLCQSCANSNSARNRSLETRRKISERHKGWSTFSGKVHSDKTKQKLSNFRIGEKYSDSTKLKMAEAIKAAMHRPEVRERHIKALLETQYLGRKTDKGQSELLEKWNRMGFEFKPNYPVHSNNFMAYVDGYDEKHKVAIEYDSKYHKKPSQKSLDLIRQQKIIDILHPKKFWRYDAVKKQFTQEI